LWIENVTRSKAMKEVIDVNVSFDTSFEDIELLRLEMEKFVRSPENSRDFQPDVTIGVGGVNDLDKLTLKIAIKHKSNWHNEAVRATRRSKFLCALALSLKRVPIHGPGGGGEPLGGPLNPAYSVAVSDDFASNARTKSDKTKEAGRLANQGLNRMVSTSSSKLEEEAAQILNTHSPVADALNDWGYENTLYSRENSADRTNDAARRDFMAARESQRGRRRAGDTLPPMPLAEGAPGLTITRAESNRTRNASFDVERQAGLGLQGPSTAQYAGAAYAVETMGASPPMTGTSMFPAYSAPTAMAGGLTLGQPHPLQSAPTGSTSVTGARARGASVSRVQAERSQSQASNNGTSS
jgi:hypothetical protein